VGSQQIRLFAVSALLLDRMANREKADRLSPELLKTLYASVLAQSIGPRVGADPEGSAICAMFRGIGRVMVALYEDECFAAVNLVATPERVSEMEAVRRVTGTTFERIGQGILEHWSIPETIVKTVAYRPPGASVPQSKVERLQLVSQFAMDAAAAVNADNAQDRSAQLAAALSSYGAALKIDSSTLTPLLDAASERIRAFARALEVESLTADAHSSADDLLAGTPGIEMRTEGATAPAAIHRSPEGKPSNSTELLLAGIRDMTTGLAEGDDPSGILNIALET